MTAYTHRAKRAHYGVNDKVEKKDFQKDKNSDDTGGCNGCDKDKVKDLKNKICWLCGHVNWRSEEFCSQCGTNCFVPVCLGTYLILVILYDFLILYLIRMKKFLRSTDDVVSAAITLCSQSNTKTGTDGHFTLSVLKRVPSLIPRCNCRQERRRGPTLHMYKYTEKLQKTCNSKLVKTKLKDSINTQRQHRFQITLYL
jgi:hypothetical protein